MAVSNRTARVPVLPPEATAHAVLDGAGRAHGIGLPDCFPSSTGGFTVAPGHMKDMTGFDVQSRSSPSHVSANPLRLRPSRGTNRPFVAGSSACCPPLSRPPRIRRGLKPAYALSNMISPMGPLLSVNDLPSLPLFAEVGRICARLLGARLCPLGPCPSDILA